MAEQRLSTTVQNYLVTTLRLRSSAELPVPLSKLAKELAVSPISVNDMCRRLQDQGLMEYRPYKGALLTELGQRHAYDIIRRHRLWEVYLVDHLGFDYDSAHDEAHRLEHATGDLVADRLDAFLGFPTVNPDGEPIPRREGVLPECITQALSETEAGTWVHVLQVNAGDVARTELARQDIRPGVKAQILLASDQGLLLDVAGDRVSLARELADDIVVEPMGDDEDACGCTMHALDTPPGEETVEA